MPLTYTIIPELHLVYVRYWGVANIGESMQVFAQYASDPDFRADQKHLIDLKDVVEYERSFPELIKLQAEKADTLMQSKTPNLMVYYAPNRNSHSMARTILKSWDGLGATVGLIAQTEHQALSMLGLGVQSFAELPMRSA